MNLHNYERVQIIDIHPIHSTVSGKYSLLFYFFKLEKDKILYFR